MSWMDDENWVLKDIQEVEQEAMNAIKNFRDNSLVVAGPGAGKTELLAQKACFLIETGKCKNKKIISLSFKKDAANNLKERICARIDKVHSRKFESTTFDAFCKSILDRFYTSLPDQIRPTADYEIVLNLNTNEFIKEIKHNGVGFQGLTAIELNKIQPKRFEEKYILKNISDHDHTVDARIRKFTWQYLLKGKSRLTFKMISVLARYILEKNKTLSNAIISTYKYVFIDEFQDTTNLQYNLIKTIFLNGDIIITAVGDDKQRIMGWAGALATIFDDYKRDFKIKRSNVLLSNRRSKHNLILFQRRMEKFMAGQFIGERFKPADGEGDAKIFQFNNSKEESEHLKKVIKYWLEDVSHRDICVLIRYSAKQYTNDIINSLADSDIKCRFENEYQDLLNEPVVQLALKLLMFVYGKKSIDDWNNVLDLFCDINGANRRNEVAKLERKLSTFIKGSVYHKGEVVDYLYALLNIFGISELKAVFPQYSQGNSIEFHIVKFALLLEKLNARLDFKYALEVFLGENVIPIMTIHKSKGLEFKKVIILGVEPDAYFGNEEEQIENQKTIFVGFSRAIEEVIITRCFYREDKYARVWEQDFNRIPLITNMLKDAGINVCNG